MRLSSLFFAWQVRLRISWAECEARQLTLVDFSPFDSEGVNQGLSSPREGGPSPRGGVYWSQHLSITVYLSFSFTRLEDKPRPSGWKHGVTCNKLLYLTLRGGIAQHSNVRHILDASVRTVVFIPGVCCASGS